MSNVVNLTPAAGSGMINELVGNVMQVRLDHNVIKHQYDIILSEFQELTLGVLQGDWDEIRDGLNDVRFTVDGMAHRLGINVPADYAALHASQLSKFDLTHEDALKTRQKYEAKNVKTRIAERTYDNVQYFVTLVDGDQVMDGRPVRDGKFLKSFRFQEPIYIPMWRETEIRMFGTSAHQSQLFIPTGSNTVDLDTVSICNPVYLVSPSETEPFTKLSVNYQMTDTGVELEVSDENTVIATVTVSREGAYKVQPHTTRLLGLTLLFKTV